MPEKPTLRHHSIVPPIILSAVIVGAVLGLRVERPLEVTSAPQPAEIAQPMPVEPVEADVTQEPEVSNAAQEILSPVTEVAMPENLDLPKSKIDELKDRRILPDRVLVDVGAEDTTETRDVRVTEFKVGVGYKVAEGQSFGVEAGKEFRDYADTAGPGGAGETDESMKVKYSLQF